MAVKVAETKNRLGMHLSSTSTDPDDAHDLWDMLEPFHMHLAWDRKKIEKLGE